MHGVVDQNAAANDGRHGYAVGLGLQIGLFWHGIRSLFKPYAVMRHVTANDGRHGPHGRHGRRGYTAGLN